MFLKTTVSINALLFILVIPLMEVSPTHVFNPDWPAHAKLHEVWQLTSNAVLAALSLVLFMRQQFQTISACIAVAISGGFVFAYIIRHTYGGSMVHSNGTELLIVGVNPAFATMVVMCIALLIAIVMQFSKLADESRPFNKPDEQR